MAEELVKHCTAVSPTLLKLKTLKGADGKPLKIIQRIAAHDYTTFGMFLLQDENGEDVALIEKDNIIKGAESVTQAILQKWLTSDAPTRTYQHLIECLRQSELGALAELIENTTIVTTTAVVVQGNTESQQEEANSCVTYLKKIYTSMSSSHTSQHWTHLPRCEFIQLAMINTSMGPRRGQMQREEDMVKLAQCGKVDVILDHKIPINFDDLFLSQGAHPVPRVTLIEGAPGGGKSTFALHICYKWAQSLANFDIVILAYLREQAVQNATTLAEIIPASTPEMQQKMASKMQASEGEKVLFVFDGWDEFPAPLQKKSLVSTLICEPYKLSLHQSKVLITSRPASSGNLLHIADRRVEILGFTRHQIREYIEKVLDGNSTDVQKLVQHLEDHPVIEGYCYVPLHVAILVHIFLTMKGALPTTRHKLFCHLVLCCIIRELKTHDSDIDVSMVFSLDDLPDDLKSKLNDLCVLAYEGVMRNQVVFYQKDLQNFHLPTNLLSLGLLQAVERLTLYNKSLSYNFLHLSVQELLAAYHISQFDPSKQLEVFKNIIDGSQFPTVLQYFSGFTKLANPAIRDFISTYARQFSNIKDLFPLLYAFYESQDVSLGKLVERQLDDDFLISYYWNPVEFLAISYFIASLLSTSTCDAPSLPLKITEQVDDHMLMLFFLELSKQSTNASTRKLEIEFYQRDITIERAKLIASLIEKSSYLSKLTITRHCKIERGALLYIAEALQKMTCRLASLQIFGREVYSYICNESEGLALKKMCETNKSLTNLTLTRMSSSYGYIFQGLQQNTTLTHLHLSDTSLEYTEGGKQATCSFMIPNKVDTTQVLTTMIQVNKTLTHLDLSHNWSFSRSLHSSLFCCLQHNTTLVKLNISDIELVAVGNTAQALTTMLQVNKTLAHLDLSRNYSFSDSGALCISQGLHHNTALLHLNLTYTEITDKGAEYIAQALETNCSLQTLDISKNRITDNGFALIDKSLETNTNSRLSTLIK